MVNEQSKRHKRKILEGLDKYSSLGTSELSEFTRISFRNYLNALQSTGK